MSDFPQRVDEAAGLRHSNKLPTDRFTTASGQLGDDSAAVRLQGVHALAALADEAPTRALRQTCIDALCAYLRRPDKPDLGDDPGPVDLRHAIIRLIREHLQGDAAVSWRDHDFDFTDVAFGSSASFQGATFTGNRVSFTHARFSGGEVSFEDATFSGSIVDFSHAIFSGGSICFTNAAFSSCEVNFEDATFFGSRITFFDATFSGSTVFFNATFSGHTIIFEDAAFSGDRIGFNNASFIDSQIEFEGGFGHSRCATGQ